MKKIIKRSNRGLTFSFHGENTNFNIGSNYRYIIEPKSRKIYILSSNAKNSLKVSKKKVGKSIKSLIDLRAKSVKNVFENAEFIEVKIEKSTIVVDILREITTSKLASVKNKLVKSNKVININKKLNNFKSINTLRIDSSLLDKVSGDTSYFSLNSFLSTFQLEEDNRSSEEVKELTEGIKTSIKVLSLFSGAGMLDYAFNNDSNFKIIKAVEYNKSACNSYRKNIGDIIINEDIRRFSIDDSNEYDLLLGGPPCTPYSNSNRISRLENHKDIDLMGEFIRVINSYKFKAFMMENVPQVITSNKGEYMRSLKEKLSNFDIKYLILQDNECGGYTTRKRAFIFGSRIGEISLNYVKKVGKTVGDALRKVNSRWFNFNDITNPNTETKKRMSCIPQGGNWMDLPGNLYLPSFKLGKTHSNTYRRLELNKPSVTLCNYRKCNIIHPIEDRGLSVAEASAISGFDEKFKFIGTLAEKQLQVSNGVPYHLGITVKNIIKRLFIRYNKENLVLI